MAPTSLGRRRYLRSYQLRWMAARRAAWFAENGPCAHCGSWEELEVDHVEPELKVDHKVWSWSDARREAELAKCQALCHDCHLEKTASEWHGRWSANSTEHSGSGAVGTTGGYRRGCRCRACCRAKSEDQADYRARVRARDDHRRAG